MSNNPIPQAQPVNVSIPDKLIFFAQEKARYKVAYGGRGSGKCLGLGTQVLMYDGSLKRVEDVKVGDLVMGPDSTPRKVLTTTTGVSELYEIIQTSGMTYVVNDEHILSLKKSTSCAKETGELSAAGNPRRPRGRYPIWPDVTNISIKEYLPKSARWKDRFRGYRAGMIEYPKQVLEIDPYLLGLWLGDGLHRELMITTMDPEIKTWLKQYCNTEGLRFTEGGKADTKAKDIRLGRIQATHGDFNPIWAHFKDLNLVGNKHIPQKYISNSKENRLKLLAGLIDTDGTLEGKCYYSITSSQELLAQDIKRLVDSLGFRSSITKRKTKCYNNGKEGIAWSVSISGNIWEIPCLLPRKQIKQEDLRSNKDKTLSQVTVVSKGIGPYAGFSLDGDHLFCLADGTVTHNSWAAAISLVVLAVNRKIKVLCTRELQNSINDSVHSLLKGAIERAGLTASFEITLTSIRAANGSEFIFKGLRNNINEIKSLEGIDICWVEEAAKISQAGWDTLIPTIRKTGSEIWITFNPDEELDETYQRFVKKPRTNSIVSEVNYIDNPFFETTSLWQDMEDDRLMDPEKYNNIWLGQPKTRSDAQVFKDKWMIQDFITPHHSEMHHKRIFFGADFGFNPDPATLIRCWIRDRRLYIDYEAYQSGVPLDGLDGLYQTVPGSKEWKIWGDSARPDIINKLQGQGYKIFSVKKTTVSQDPTERQKAESYIQSGIDYLRNFEKIVVHPRCKQTINELTNYKYKVDKNTGIILPEIIDKYSHLIDALRYSLAEYISKPKTSMADIVRAHQPTPTANG